MFPVKHTVIYTFFAITSVQNTCFCSVFNALASKNPAKSCYVQCFFHFWPFFPLPESYQNDPKFHFNTLLRSDTQKSSKNVENTTVFWSRCETVFGPPPAKADIATAILTNVIEHLVLLLPPNKHAFTAKAVWADLPIPGLGSSLRNLLHQCQWFLFPPIPLGQTNNPSNLYAWFLVGK